VQTHRYSCTHTLAPRPQTKRGRGTWERENLRLRMKLEDVEAAAMRLTLCHLGTTAAATTMPLGCCF